MEGLLTPVVGVQLKVVASLLIHGLNEAPRQIVVSILLLSVGSALTVIVNERVILQEPVEAVSV